MCINFVSRNFTEFHLLVLVVFWWILQGFLSTLPSAKRTSCNSAFPIWMSILHFKSRKYDGLERCHSCSRLLWLLFTYLRTNFFPVFVKNAIGIFIGITLNLQIAQVNIDILSVIFQSMNRAVFSFVCVFFYFHHQCFLISNIQVFHLFG